MLHKISYAKDTYGRKKNSTVKPSVEKCYN
jgi:hypothetical protein